MLGGRNIREIDIAFGGFPVPTKHGVDGLRELGEICFVNATAIHPKVSQAIVSHLISAEPELLIASLVPADAIYQVVEGDLFIIRSPGVGEYRIRWSFIANEVFGQDEFVSAVTF